MDENSSDHTVQQGECLSSIAASYGHAWQTVWEHPRNADLRALREDPNILMPGDHVYVPPIETRQEPKASNQLHKFERKDVPARLQLQFCIEGEPRAGETYVLTTSDGQILDGTLDGNGQLTETITPNATWAHVVVGTGAAVTVFDFDLGGMDPVTEPGGVHKRLLNQGHLLDAENPSDDEVKRAVLAFQDAQRLPKTGDVEDIRTALKKVHGS